MKYIYIILVLLFGYNWLGAQMSNQTDAHVVSPNDNYISMDYFNTNTGHYINDGKTHILYNWNNEGLVDFTIGETTGLTKFVGISTQTISGNGLTKYYNLLLNNTFTNASIQLQKEINIYGISDFTDGVAQESINGLFVFQNNAGHIHTSDESFVDGNVRKIGDDAFTFPIGDNDGSGVFLYRMAAISAPASVTDAYDAQYFWKLTNSVHPILSKQSIIETIDESEYWEINQINGASNIDITLSWHSTEVTTNPNTILSDLSKLIIVRWDGVEWINEGGIANSGNKTITTTPTGYGTFTLGRVYFDSDGDGVTDEQEVTDGTDPNDNCSFVLANQIVDPDDIWNNTDCDGDGITNADEKTAGTDPLDPCSNTYVTADEICLYVTANPNSGLALADCDGGGVDNITECNRGGNPINSLDDPTPNPDNNESYVDILVSGDLNTNDRDIPVGSTYGNAIGDASNPDNTLPMINADGTYTFLTSVPGIYKFQVPITTPNGDVIFVSLTINIIDPDTVTNFPIANTDIGTTLEGTPITMPVMSNDRSGNIGVDIVESSVAITIISNNGGASVDLVTREITYTPDPGFIGKDTLEYRIKDELGNEARAFFIITVLSNNAENNTTASDDYYATEINLPVSGNVLVNDSDPQGDSQIVFVQDTTVLGKGHFVLEANGDFVFTPETDFVGPINFPYGIKDNNVNADTSYATVYILVESIYAIVGDFVWEDINGDGRQDSNEPGVGGVIVDLIPIGSFTATRHTTTDNNGKYLFEDVVDGKYYLKFNIADEFDYTLYNTSGEYIDSDVDGSHGYGTTATFDVMKNQNQNGWDAGVYKCIEIGDLTWLDYNMNDVYDSNEAGVNGMKVGLFRLVNNKWVLWDVDITGINPNSVCGDGYYSFCTNPGIYHLYFDLPPLGLVPAQPLVGNNTEIDCNITRANGNLTTDAFTLGSGDQGDFSIDAGFYDMAMVTNSLAWIDDDQDGMKSANEQGVPNMLVEIFDINGNLYSSTHTDLEGNYYLDYLQAEDYYLKFHIPSNYAAYGFTISNQGSDDVDSDVTGEYGNGTTSLFQLNPDEEKQHQDAGLSQGTLPLNTLFIGAEWQKDKVLVKWVTSNEFGVDKFIVQRAFDKGDDFVDIGNVNANGEKTNSYYFNDTGDFKNGIYYYRIIAVDEDGKNTISKVVAVFVSDNKELNLDIFPNPVANNAIVKFELSDLSNVKIDLFDLQGKQVINNIVDGSVEMGIHQSNIDVSELPAETYYLRFATEQGIVFKKLIVIGK